MRETFESLQHKNITDNRESSGWLLVGLLSWASVGTGAGLTWLKMRVFS